MEWVFILWFINSFIYTHPHLELTIDISQNFFQKVMKASYHCITCNIIKNLGIEENKFYSQCICLMV